MRHILFLAWRYLAYHRIKSVILVMSITLIVFLPVGLRVLVKQSERELTTRAEATPLVVGAKGSPLELVLNSLYFESDAPTPMRYEEVLRVGRSNLAEVIPIYTRYRVGDTPIVGTTLEYFAFRRLEVASGRQIAVLGECVVGADAADKLGVSIGGVVLSSPENVFDLAGVYPLKMGVVGVLERSYTPDDDAVFVDIKTSWVIEGLGHGHQDLTKPGAASGVLRRESDKVVANASVLQYNEITDDNLASFHFHGVEEAFPVTAAVVIPHDDKSAALLQGRYVSDDEKVQVVRPVSVMDELLATILTVQSYIIAAVVVIGVATFATALLVFMLSLRLRRREIQTIVKIGGSRARVFGIVVSEIVGVLVLGVSLAVVLTLLTSHFGAGVIRALIVS